MIIFFYFLFGYIYVRYNLCGDLWPWWSESRKADEKVWFYWLMPTLFWMYFKIGLNLLKTELCSGRFVRRRERKVMCLRCHLQTSSTSCGSNSILGKSEAFTKSWAWFSSSQISVYQIGHIPLNWTGKILKMLSRVLLLSVFMPTILSQGMFGISHRAGWWRLHHLSCWREFDRDTVKYVWEFNYIGRTQSIFFSDTPAYHSG